MKKIKYCEILPRIIITKRKCQFLDSSGERCGRLARIENHFFGDSESASGTTWVTTELCKEHFSYLFPYDKSP